MSLVTLKLQSESRASSKLRHEVDCASSPRGALGHPLTSARFGLDHPIIQ